MPIYAYRCEACGHAKDVLRKISDPPLSTCPACGADAFRKQVTAAGFQLKGSGWYATDFKNGSKPATPDAANKDATKPDGSKPDTTKPDSPATASAPTSDSGTASGGGSSSSSSGTSNGKSSGGDSGSSGSGSISAPAGG